MPAPRYLFEEIAEHWPQLSRRARLPEDSLKEVLRILRNHAVEHGPESYEPHLEKAREILRGKDVHDAPYVGLALAIAADGLWSEDKGISSVPGIPVFRTSDLMSR